MYFLGVLAPAKATGLYERDENVRANGRSPLRGNGVIERDEKGNHSGLPLRYYVVVFLATENVIETCTKLNQHDIP